MSLNIVCLRGEGLTSRKREAMLTKFFRSGRLRPRARAWNGQRVRGLNIYNFQEGRDNVPRYLPKSYDIWFSKMLSAFERTPENLISDTRRYL